MLSITAAKKVLRNELIFFYIASVLKLQNTNVIVK